MMQVEMPSAKCHCAAEARLGLYSGAVHYRQSHEGLVPFSIVGALEPLPSDFASLRQG